jgi:hypothetical protein
MSCMHLTNGGYNLVWIEWDKESIKSKDLCKTDFNRQYQYC